MMIMMMMMCKDVTDREVTNKQYVGCGDGRISTKYSNMMTSSK